MNIQSGRSKELTVSGKKVKGFTFACYVKHGTAATNLANSDFLPENIILELNLHRGGGVFPLLPQGNLKVMHLATNFYNGSFEKSAPNAAAAVATVLVEQNTGIKEEWLYELSFNFHGVIDLQKGEKLVLKVNFASSALSAAVSTADTYIDVNEVTDQWSYETFTPTWDILNVQASESKVEKQFSNLKDLVFINLDKTSVLAASAVITQATVNSKMMSYTDRYNDMLTRRASAFSSKEDADARLQCFDLYDGDISPNATVTLTTTSSNVNANKCFLVGCTAYTDARLVELANAKEKKHFAAKLIRSGINAGNGLAVAEKQVNRFQTN